MLQQSCDRRTKARKNTQNVGSLPPRDGAYFESQRKTTRRHAGEQKKEEQSGRAPKQQAKETNKRTA